METVLVMNDTQIPFHDPAALSVVEQVMYNIQPDIIVYLGDIFDFPGLSTKFRRPPDLQHRLLQEVEMGRDIFRLHRALVPGARRIYIAGNHEERLRNYVVDMASELAVLLDEGGALSLTSLVRLDLLGIEYIGPYGAAWEHNSFLFKHGDRAVQYTSAAELLYEGTSGMSAHTHRGGSAYRTNRSGAHGWWENFCLCNIEGPNQPPAAFETTGVRNWQQGFSVVYFDQGHFAVVPVVINKGRCIFNGRLYSA